jgi:hypothetical protein
MYRFLGTRDEHFMQQLSQYYRVLKKTREQKKRDGESTTRVLDNMPVALIIRCHIKKRSLVDLERPEINTVLTQLDGRRFPHTVMKGGIRRRPAD